MSFRVISASSINVKLSSPILHKEPEKKLKLARARLDREAESRGIGWKKVLALAGELTGHTRGLSIADCRLVLKEIKKGRKI